LFFTTIVHLQNCGLYLYSSGDTRFCQTLSGQERTRPHISVSSQLVPNRCRVQLRSPELAHELHASNNLKPYIMEADLECILNDLTGHPRNEHLKYRSGSSKSARWELFADCAYFDFLVPPEQKADNRILRLVVICAVYVGPASPGRSCTSTDQLLMVLAI